MLFSIEKEDKNRAMKLYSEAVHQLQKSLVSQASNYDLYQMYLSIVMMVLMLVSNIIMMFGTASKNLKLVILKIILLWS